MSVEQAKRWLPSFPPSFIFFPLSILPCPLSHVFCFCDFLQRFPSFFSILAGPPSILESRHPPQTGIQRPPQQGAPCPAGTAPLTYCKAQLKDRRLICPSTDRGGEREARKRRAAKEHPKRNHDQCSNFKLTPSPEGVQLTLPAMGSGQSTVLKTLCGQGRNEGTAERGAVLRDIKALSKEQIHSSQRCFWVQEVSSWEPENGQGWRC